ncbi:MAG: hypothetical protein [Wigfec virus K19_174]|nr:MAG: hypothetical protein [Wigfec virus K19_174]
MNRRQAKKNYQKGNRVNTVNLRTRAGIRL